MGGFFSWLKNRVFHLPSGHNSVSDIIGASNWNAIKDTVGGLIQTAVTNALIGIENPALAVADKVLTEIGKVFPSADATFISTVKSAIEASIQSSMNRNVTVLKTNITAAIVKTVGLGK